MPLSCLTQVVGFALLIRSKDRNPTCRLGIGTEAKALSLGFNTAKVRKSGQHPCINGPSTLGCHSAIPSHVCMMSRLPCAGWLRLKRRLLRFRRGNGILEFRSGSRFSYNATVCWSLRLGRGGWILLRMHSNSTTQTINLHVGDSRIRGRTQMTPSPLRNRRTRRSAEPDQADCAGSGLAQEDYGRRRLLP